MAKRWITGLFRGRQTTSAPAPAGSEAQPTLDGGHAEAGPSNIPELPGLDELEPVVARKLAALAREPTPADLARDERDRLLLQEIADGGLVGNQALNKLLNTYRATFFRKLDYLGVPPDDQLALINDVLIAVDKDPLPNPANVPPLARMRKLLLFGAAGYFKARGRRDKFSWVPEAEVSPLLSLHRTAGALAGDVDAGHDDDAKKAFRLVRRPDDPTLDLASSRRQIDRIRDLLDKQATADPRLIKQINLLNQVWTLGLNTAEVAEYRWRTCLAKCVLLCTQFNCAERQGTEEGARQELHRARAWIAPLLKQLFEPSQGG